MNESVATLISVLWGQLLAPGLLLVVCGITLFVGRRPTARAAMAVYTQRTANRPPRNRNIFTWSPTLTESRATLLIMMVGATFVGIGLLYIIAAVI